MDVDVDGKVAIVKRLTRDICMNSARCVRATRSTNDWIGN